MSHEELAALRRSCNPAGVLSFLSGDVMLSLRKLDYIEIVLGGAQITTLGLERLTRENARRAKP